jgi:hypothetical protein
VLPQQIVALARGLSWHRDGDTLHLDAPCPHQAVHATLADLTDEADELAARTLELADDLRESEADLLAAVPHRVTDRDLRPQRVADQVAYEVPLLRFHLAQTEVRDLLTGKQLYGGEPEPALRELYQNAMDACRYRAMRWSYLNSSGTRPADWSGRIVFTRGRDERGPYVECRDMSAEQLKQTFTRAGSRFERSKSFRKEQSRWLRHDPALDRRDRPDRPRVPAARRGVDPGRARRTRQSRRACPARRAGLTRPDSPGDHACRQGAAVCCVAGVAMAATAIAVARVTTETAPDHLVRITTTTGERCGEFMGSGPNGVTLKAEGGRSVVLPAHTVTSVAPVSACG